MKFKHLICSLLLFYIIESSCKPHKTEETIVCITTEMGIIKLKLYNETPLHRDNFINLINKGYFTNKIFHRVIKNFMIQGGSSSVLVKPDLNPESNFNYTVPAEINKKDFHKRGALAAARKSDVVNPKRESTATQFYIVEGEKLTQDQLQQVQDEINSQLIQSKARKYYLSDIKKAKVANTPFNEQSIVKTAIAKAQEENLKNPFAYSEEQRKTYTTIGGAPHLDGTYTVFGEVTEGMNVVDKIAYVKTTSGDKPEKEIKFSIKLLK